MIVQQQPGMGMMGNMVSTAAGVATGVVVGNAISSAFEGGAEAPQQQEMQYVQPAPQQTYQGDYVQQP